MANCRISRAFHPQARLWKITVTKAARGTGITLRQEAIMPGNVQAYGSEMSEFASPWYQMAPLIVVCCSGAIMALNNPQFPLADTLHAAKESGVDQS